jgi:hypothetical protein
MEVNEAIRKEKEYHKEYYLKNKEKIKEYLKEYRNRSENKERKKQYDRQWRLTNRIKLRKHKKQWYLKNKEKIDEWKKQWYQKNKKRINKDMRERWKTDLKFNLNNRISASIWRSIKINKNYNHWENLVGYTVNDLIRHLKKTMPKNHTWENYLNGELHIDHIIPISAFNFDSIENPDFKKCWALENLQLLPAKENISKNNKLTKPFQPALKI